MCKKLAKHKETYDTKVYIKAIEQKFATLTVYMEYATGTELDIIQNATNASYTVCEDCGNPGEFHSDNGWEYILCNDCTIFHILQKD
jgi:anaerobic ribonucleoside-triphosphate reductase